MPDLRNAKAIAVFATLCCLTPGPAATDPAADDLLGPRHIVEIRVGRWDPVDETYLAWDGVSGTFRIGPAGTLMLPLVGRVEAGGLTPETLGEEIERRLADQMGLQSQIDAAVTIAEYPPVYVLGDVRAPGEYAFMPGMNVIQALGLAGGTENPGLAILRGERDALAAQGRFRVQELELGQRLAALARLEAERDGGEIAVPPELENLVGGSALVASERQIKDAREEAFQSSLAQIDDLESLLTERIAGLEQQRVLREGQLALLRQESSNVERLADQGLTTSARQSALQREVADQQVRLLEVETARLNAEQRLNEPRRDRLELTTTRRRELLEGIRDERSAIAELRVRMETEAALVAEANGSGNGVVALMSGARTELRITRTGPDGPSSGLASPTDPLRGGDVLTVRIALFDTETLSTAQN